MIAVIENDMHQPTRTLKTKAETKPRLCAVGWMLLFCGAALFLFSDRSSSKRPIKEEAKEKEFDFELLPKGVWAGPYMVFNDPEQGGTGKTPLIYRLLQRLL